MKKNKNTLLLFIFSTFIMCYCNGQDFLTEVRHYDIEDGLSHSQVLSIYKDSHGMVWTLAKDKLNRFDGKKFKGYGIGRMFHPFARIIGEDQNGDLWITNAFEKESPVFFNTKRKSFQTFSQKFSDTAIKDYSGVEFYLPGASGHYFFGTTSSELLRYDPLSQSLQTIQFDDNTRVVPLYEDSDGLIWANIIINTSRYRGTSRVVGLDQNGKVKHEFYFDQIIFNFNKIDAKQFSFTDHDHLYTVDEKRTLKKYPLSRFFDRPNLKNGEILFHKTKYDPVGKQYWFFDEEKKLSIFHLEKGLLMDGSKNDLSIEMSYLHDIFIDDNGMAWLGSLNGLYKLQGARNNFKQYFSVDSKEKEQDEISCRKIDNDANGNLYVNSNRGIFQIKANTENTNRKKPEIQNIKNGTSFILANLVDDENKFWFARTDTIYRYKNDQLDKLWPMSSGFVWSMYKGEHKLWLGSEGSKIRDRTLSYIDLKKDELFVFDQYNGFEDLKRSTIYSIQKTSDGLQWLVTDKGLFVLNDSSGIQAHYSTQGIGKYNMPVDEFKHLYEDENGIFWLASTQGLLSWNRQQNSFQQFTDKEGLSHNNLHAIYEDDFGFLWMSSDYGINQFQKSTQKIKTYLSVDGISHHEFNRISHHQIKNKNLEQNGMIYFGGLNGVTAFHPKDFVDQFDTQLDIPIVLLKAEVYRDKTNSVEELNHNWEANHSLLIHPGDQALNLEFALLNYEEPKNIQYEYYIAGQTKNWISCNNNTLLISGLSYGKQELIIRAKSGKGVYSKQELRIPIQVLRPFYLQLWFAILSIGMFVTMSFVAYKQRTKKLMRQKKTLEREVSARTRIVEKQAEELRYLDKIKSRFFANVSHELRTPLTLILGPLNAVLKRNEIQAEDAKLIATANQNAKNLLQLTNEILDLTKLEASKMEMEESPVFILQETRRIFSSFETQAYQQGINFQFTNDINPELQIQLDLNKFEKIINNLLVNALKFTNKNGKVMLRLAQNNKNIRIQVQDSGKGISPTDLPHIFERFYQSKDKNAATEGGTGIGLALCLEFSKLFKGRIWAESEIGKGSTFYFEFPKKEVQITIEAVEEIEQVMATSSQDAIPELVANFKSKILEKEILNENLLTILVAEDNIDLRDFLKFILQKRYNVLCTENGKEAWEALQNNKNIHLILSDLMMPVMDGFQLVEQIKSSETFQSIPIVMLTARVDLQDKLKALRIGVDDYIMKPFQEEELLVRIQNLLKNASLRKAYQRETKVEVVGTDTEEANLLEPNKTDRDWLVQVERNVLSHISNFEFNAEILAKTIFLSRRQLDRRLKLLTGLTTGEYIREARLQQARKLIESRDFQSIKEICYEVGIKSPAYFSKQYKNRFGISPAELLR